MSGSFLPVVAREYGLIRQHAHNRFLIAIFVARKVFAARPVVAAVRRSENPIGREIDRVVVVRRDDNRRIPIEAVLLLARRRLRLDRSLLAGFHFQARDKTLLRLDIHDRRVSRVHDRIETIAATDAIPVVVGDALRVQRAARAGPTAVVLQAAVNPKRFLIVERDFIELADRNGVDEIPRTSAIVGLVNPAVRSGQHMVRIFRIDPKRVKVAVDTPYDVRHPGLAAVVGDVHGRGRLPDALIVVGIDANLAVVHWTRIDVAHLAPMLAAIFGTKHTAFRILDDGVNNVRIAAIDIDADASRRAFRQIDGKFFPGRAAVNGFINRAARAAAIESERCPPSLICRSVKRHRALRIHRHIDHAGVFIDEKHIVPGLAAIRCFVQPALFVRSPQMPDYSYVNNFRVMRIDHDAPDVP